MSLFRLIGILLAFSLLASGCAWKSHYVPGHPPTVTEP